ncbi:MAG: hypothetical protein WB523_04990 [Candidatus Sulfotelmatobacter sp.]
MNRILLCILSGALMAGVAIAQDSATPLPSSSASQPQTPAAKPTPQTEPSAPAHPTRIAPGSVIPVLLTKTIDAKKVKAGDEVVAKVTEDMKTTSGEVLVPKDTKVMGHITEAQARNKEQKESEVAIAFDRAVTKNGTEMQMPMSIQAIIGSQNNGPQNSNGGGGSSEMGASSPASPNPNGGARPGMGGSAAAPTPSASTGSEMPNDAQNRGNARPTITANTQGVVGISNLTLTAAAPNPAPGSLVTSEKNNVKLESGTMMLLRVNP